MKAIEMKTSSSILGVPSWVIPGTYAENIRFLEDKREVLGVELLFFIYDDGIKTMLDSEWEEILGFRERFVFTAHLPDPLLNSHEELVARLAPLVRHCIVHPAVENPADQARLLAEWSARYGVSFLAENTRAGLLENLLPFLDTSATQGSIGICMDCGHLLLEGQSPADFFTRYRQQIGEIHLHGIDLRQATIDGRLADHRRIRGDEPWLNELFPMLEDYRGVINLEVFSWEEAAAGIETVTRLHRLLNRKKAWTRRDVTIAPVMENNCLVIACDSCGSVGIKAGDTLKVPPRYTGRFTARVALTEVMCTGAVPVTITNGVANEMTPTGGEIILGIQDELNNAGVMDVVLTGSTEENFATSMTALVITVVGIARESELKFIPAVKGDKLILLGRPQMGAGVDLESVGFYTEIAWLLSLPDVREIVPVGSKGIAYEAETLASLNNMVFTPYKTDIDCHTSAGPVTCLLVLCAETSVDQVLSCNPTGTVIGEFR